MTRDDLQWITENQSWNPAERLSQSHSHHFALPFSVLNNLTCGKSHSCRKILGKATYNLNPQTVFSRSEEGSVLPFWADFSDCGRELCLCLGEKKLGRDCLKAEFSSHVLPVFPSCTQKQAGDLDMSLAFQPFTGVELPLLDHSLEIHWWQHLWACEDVWKADNHMKNGCARTETTSRD